MTCRYFYYLKTKALNSYYVKLALDLKLDKCIIMYGNFSILFASVAIIEKRFGAVSKIKGDSHSLGIQFIMHNIYYIHKIFRKHIKEHRYSSVFKRSKF